MDCAGRCATPDSPWCHRSHANWNSTGKETVIHISDQEYFRSCIARERHLAQLLGHQHIEKCWESAATLWTGNQALPKWTRDWRACAALMAEHGIGVVKELSFLLEHGKLARPLPGFVNVAA